MNKNIIMGIVGGLIIGFGAGYLVPHRAAAPAGPGGYSGTFARGGGRTGAGGIAAGQILSADATSITLKLPNGNTQIVLIGGSTQIMKTATGTVSDLSAGKDVVVTGSTNSDGSITAQSVQVRPATTVRAQ
jgi:hypothetical protein